MASHKVDRSYFRVQLVCLTLTVLWASVSGNFFNDRFDTLLHHRPWRSLDHDVHLDFASSDYSPTYSRFHEAKKRHSTFDSTESFDAPQEYFSATKKIPREDKHFKKIISPFYTITEKDSAKYKDVVMKSGVPYCQEIKSKKPNKNGNAKDSTVCFKCKNPKNGATYEQCSFVSQPLSDSSMKEEVVVAAPSFRTRRSNSEESYKGFNDYKKRSSPYRFNEKLFSDASEDVPSDHKNKGEKCEKVLKDTMVCMVCRDTKSNGKYEQCSYVRQPKEKLYAYSKSSSFKNPQRREDEEAEEPRKYDRQHSESKPVREESGPSEKYRESERSQKASEDSSSNCRKVEKDSKTCTVCKDPETGGNYEKCSYSFQPDDKVYKFSRSKSFGYPQESSKERSDDDEESSAKSAASEEYKRDYTVPESYYSKQEPSESKSYFNDDERSSSYRHAPSRDSKPDKAYSSYEKSKSESQRVAESIEPSNCKEVEKDSMTCKVCKDPKTGSNSEQCSYKYQPTDKQFSYSKSRSFGSPTGSDESSGASEKTEQREPSYKEQSYDYSSDKKPYSSDSKPYSSDSNTKRDFRESESSKDSETEVAEESTTKAPKKVDADFYDAFRKKAEIQKFLQEFQKEDRSNCKKLMRDKMTCYQCVDEKGFQKEECAFVGAEEAADDKSKYREAEESEEEPSKKVPRSVKPEEYLELPVELEASASENVQVKVEKPESGKPEDKEQSKEAEPYEYVAETRPVFDKVLGFTLPAYMLSTSEHEEEFDRIIASRV